MLRQRIRHLVEVPVGAAGYDARRHVILDALGARVNALRDRADNDVAIGNDPAHLAVVHHDDIADVQVIHQFGRVHERHLGRA